MSSEVHFPFSQVYSIHRIANPFEQLSVSGTPRRPNPPPGIEYHDSRVNIVLGRFSQSQDIHMWWALGDAESLKKIEARCRYWYATLLDSWEDERDIPPKLSQFIYDRLKRQKGMFMCFELDLDLARKKLARNGGVFVSNNKESESEEEVVRVVLMKEKGKEKGKEGTEEKEEVEVKDGEDTEEEIQPTVKKALKLGKQSFSSIDDEYLWERPRPTAAPLPAPPAPAPQPSAAEAQAAQAAITAAVNAERLRQSTFKAEQGPSYDPRHPPPRGRDRSRDRNRRRSRSRSRDRGRYRTWHRHDYVDLDRERERSRSPDLKLKRSGSPPPRPKTPPKKYDDGYIHPSRMAPARTPSPDNVDMANMVVPIDSGMDEIHMSRYYGFLDHMNKKAEQGIAGAFSHMNSGNNNNSQHSYATTPPPGSAHKFNPKTRNSISNNPYEDDDDDDGAGFFGSGGVNISYGGGGGGGGGGPRISIGGYPMQQETSSESTKATKMERARHLSTICDWLSSNPKLMSMISIPANISYIDAQLLEKYKELGGPPFPEETRKKQNNYMYGAVVTHVSTQKHLWPALSAELERRRAANGKEKSKKSKGGGGNRPSSSHSQEAYPRGGYPQIGAEGGAWAGFGRGGGNDRGRGRGNDRGGYGGDRGRGRGGDRGRARGRGWSKN